MKHKILIALLILLFIPATLSSSKFSILFKESEQSSQSIDINRIIKSFMFLESSGDSSKVNGIYKGILQIGPTMVNLANEIKSKDNKTLFSHKDVWSQEKSIEIFLTVQKELNPSFDLKEACFIWYGGFTSKNTTNKGKIKRIENYYNKLKLIFENEEYN